MISNTPKELLVAVLVLALWCAAARLKQPRLMLLLGCTGACDEKLDDLTCPHGEAVWVVVFDNPRGALCTADVDGSVRTETLDLLLFAFGAKRPLGLSNEQRVVLQAQVLARFRLACVVGGLSIVVGPKVVSLLLLALLRGVGVCGGGCQRWVGSVIEGSRSPSGGGDKTTSTCVP